MSNNEIQFIKPCRIAEGEGSSLTSSYARKMFRMGKIVQINLDNCSIQRMEQLPINPTVSDVEKVGLLPLVELLKTCPVCLTAIGIHEMPDMHVKNARAAYERFCATFWPSHCDDQDATFREYDNTSQIKKIVFDNLNDELRRIYGVSYISILQIQNIKLNYSDKAPEKKFEIYIYGLIALLDTLSAFEIEIAKYTFWDLDTKSINRLPRSIRVRRKDIKDNFAAKKTSLKKCKEFSFGAAMDLHWLSAANFSEDLKGTITIESKVLKLDIWIGTNDHKLYRICQDIYSVYSGNSTMKKLVSTREDFLNSQLYWKKVDAFSSKVMLGRKRLGYKDMSNLLVTIDRAIVYLDAELDKGFSLNG